MKYFVAIFEDINNFTLTPAISEYEAVKTIADYLSEYKGKKPLKIRLTPELHNKGGEE